MINFLFYLLFLSTSGRYDRCLDNVKIPFIIAYRLHGIEMPAMHLDLAVAAGRAPPAVPVLVGKIAATELHLQLNRA